MTILYGDNGKVSVGNLKTFTINLATPLETLKAAGSEIALPATEPASGAAGTVSYTIQASDLPTITPSPFSVKYSAYLYLSGKNTSGSTVTISYSIYKNGTQIVGAQNQAGVTNNLFWTQSHYRFFDVQVGDVLEARVWCATTGAYLDYYALQVLPTRIEVTKSPIVQDVTFALVNPTLTLGTPVVAQTGNWNFYLMSNTGAIAVGNSATTTFSVACINSSTNGFSGRLSNGDGTINTTLQTHATNHPSYFRNAYPSSISFREVSR